MKYYLIVGEASGDLHASNLMKSIKEVDADAQFRFFGGDLMSALGGVRVKHYRELAYMGFVPVLMHLGTILSNMKLCKKDILAWNPDALILVDYPGFNLSVAEFVHKNSDIPVYYYISPKIWAWKEYRIKNIKRDVDELFSILPFEIDFFEKKHGYSINYVGNPCVDAVDTFLKNSAKSRDEFFKQNSLPIKPYVALLAGSRRSEIKDNLADMVAISHNFPEYQFVVAAVPWIEKALYDKILAGTAVKVVCNKTYDTLIYAESAIVTSGTATLETALVGTPEIVMYHIPKLYEWLRPIVLKIPYISLVNINLNRECVREIVVNKVDVEAVSEELRSILEGGCKRAKMLSDFAELREMMGGEGSSHRVAQDIVKSLK